jgi:hypothetical protein
MIKGTVKEYDRSKYVTSYNTLHNICSFAQQNDMKFLTLKDLVDF